MVETEVDGKLYHLTIMRGHYIILYEYGRPVLEKN